jgi:hypothetical protein
MLAVFNSHSWDYSDDREGVVRLLLPWIKSVDWFDLAVPESHPLHVDGNDLLKFHLAQRILSSDLLLMFAGVYSSYSDWIEFEVHTAKRMLKPVIAIKPRGQQNLSRLAREYADAIVGWNSESVRSAIKKHLAPNRRADVESRLIARERRALIAELLRS